MVERPARTLRRPESDVVRAGAIAAWIFVAVLELSGPVLSGTLWAAEPRPVVFNRDIRPILSANCFQCHGPDSAHREAKLRLDLEAGVRGVFVPHNLQKSAAWERINSKDDDERMPPPSAHKELKVRDIALLRQWIEEGVVWQPHWAFVPPRKVAPPAAANPGAVRNPIDNFIQARLEQEGLRPSPEADRERLLRRVTFDLTGLPPTIAEIDAFLADRSPDAYEKVVDRLLRSPHYGERMAVAWMDAARYGDTSVHHADGLREMWGWRDWVIRAYNDNMPFNQFTLEQMAGDLLPSATVSQQIATAFNRNNASSDEGGLIPEEFRVEYAVDRVKTTAMTWLGLTLECGQCHDHKYDPISQREYYQFFAYFNQAADPGMQTRRGNQAPVVNVPSVVDASIQPRLKKQVAEIQVALTARKGEVADDYAAWLKRAEREPDKALLPSGQGLLHLTLDQASGEMVADTSNHPAKVKGRPLWTKGHAQGGFETGAESHIDLGDVGKFAATDAFSLALWIKPNGVPEGAPMARMDDAHGRRGYAIQLEKGRISVNLVHRWPKNAIKVITKAAPIKPDQWQQVVVTYAGTNDARDVHIYVDGKPQGVKIEVNELKGAIETDSPLLLGRRSAGSPFKGVIDEVRVFGRVLTESEAIRLAEADPAVRLLTIAAKDRTAAQNAALLEAYVRVEDEPGRELSEELASVKALLLEPNRPVTTVMVMRDAPEPRTTYILDRGQYDSPKKDQPVRPGVPAAIAPLPKGAEANRLGLARWLVAPENPLTARVAVNRLWYLAFGNGLVRTLEDFGSQGEPPTHPELLDYLAVDFVEHGWDVKRLMRQMVTSATYRQTGRMTPELLRRDPENRLLARGPRFRLQAEFVRDNALAAAGLLVDKIGGPSVKPYQPPGLWEEVSLEKTQFVQDHGEKLYRRGMYTYWRRSSTAPSLTMFDAPSRESCTLRRPRTNTPLQALVTLNDPQYLEAARMLAERALHEGGSTPAEQITYAFRLATGVRPRSEAVALLRDGYEEDVRTMRREPGRATKLLAVGEAPRDLKLDPAVHAAMALAASAILNLDETVTRP